MNENPPLFRRYPLLPTLAAYVLGIAFCRFFSPSVSGVACGVGLVVVLSFRWTRRRRAAAVALWLGAFFLGAFRSDVLKEPAASPGFGPPSVPDGPQVYEAQVASYPSRSGDGFHFEVKLGGWSLGTVNRAIRGTAQIYLRDRTAPARGDVIRFRAALHVPRNLGNDAEWDYESYARIRGIDYSGAISGADAWGVVRPARGFFRKTLNRLRADILERAGLYLGPESSALLKCLVLGDGSEVPAELWDTFRRAGIVHLLVVSGFHVSLVFLIAAFVGGFLATRSVFWVRRCPVHYVRMACGLCGASLFCALTNLPVSTLRALGTAFAGVALVWVRRRVDPITLWLAVAAAVLAWQPLYLYDPSAQLSFLAVLGILVALRVVADHDERLPSQGPAQRLRSLKLLFFATLGATVFTFPILLFHFHRFTVWALAGNLLFVPLVGSVSTTLGVAAAYLSGPLSPVGNYLLLCFEQWNSYVLPPLHWFSCWPGSDIWVKAGSPWVWSPYAVALLSYFLWLRFRRVRGVWVAAVGAAGLLSALVFFVDHWKPHASVHFLHVGQGDSALLISKEGRAVLMDTGPGGPHGWDAGERVVVPWLVAHGVPRLDLLVLSQPDLDHAGGAATVLEMIPVGEVVSPPVGKWSKSFSALRALARSRGIPWRWADASSAPLTAGSIRLSFLNPLPGDPDLKSDSNDQSLVVRAEVEGFRMLFTGDIEANAEREMLRRNAPIRADLLKVPHHGSRTSSGESFLQAVSPRIAVITAGFRNPFHHPSADVVERLVSHGTRVFRGDECGEVDLELPGNGTVAVSSVHACKNSE